MMGIYLCTEHAAEAASQPSSFHYLCRKFGHSVSGVARVASKDFILEMTGEFLKTQLGCRIIKIAGMTITAERPSGLQLIVRLRDNRTYAYIFKDKNGIVIAKVDNADHHQVEYGPDHIHVSPRTNNNDVRSSFTYGFPMLDVKLIR